MAAVEMENLKTHDPLLELILKKYSEASRDSIRGPVATKADLQNIKNASSSSVKQAKDFTLKREPDSLKLRETMLDGFSVGCFNVGGEKRLSFTEIVQVVLKDYNVHEIFGKRDDLLIYCSKCTPQQLDALKLSGILPWTSTSSNLITKSDTFRLWGALYGNRAPKGDPKVRSPLSFEVYHECFGGCVGVFDPGMYDDPSSQCIRCTECNGMFSPKKFVSHNHTSFDEVHTCHWGFDSARWRSYLLLVEQKVSRELLMLWESIKNKGDGNRVKKPVYLEPKQDPDFVAYIRSPERKKTTLSPIESLRSDRDSRVSLESPDLSEGRPSSRSTATSENKDRHSAFHPWSPTNKSSSSSSAHTRFIFPGTGPDSHHSATPKPPSHPFAGRIGFQPASNLAVVHAQCGCPGQIGTSPLYMSCQQCKNAAAAASCSGLQLLAQKASERPGEPGETKPNIDRGTPAPSTSGGCPAGCELCQRSQSRDPLEATVEDILRKYMSSDVKQPNISDVSHLLASELKRLHLNQEDKIRELSISNQRLQAELHVVKIEYQKKLSDALDTKRRVEQELEVVQREHQKDIARFNRVTWEFQQEVNRHKASSDADGEAKEKVDALRKEVTLLKAQLEQSQIEQDNMRKQVQLWHTGPFHHRYPNSAIEGRMEVDWSPAESAGVVRHFPLSRSSRDDRHEEPRDSISTKGHPVSVVSMNSTHRGDATMFKTEREFHERDHYSPVRSNAERGIVEVNESSEESDIEIED